MKQRWEEEDLVGHWTLTGADKKLFFQRTDRGRFGLAVLLKFFQIEGRFPRYYKEVPAAARKYSVYPSPEESTRKRLPEAPIQGINP
jgi:hypothetical protein